jgi:hypothetical protein
MANVIYMKYTIQIELFAQTSVPCLEQLRRQAFAMETKWKRLKLGSPTARPQLFWAFVYLHEDDGQQSATSPTKFGQFLNGGFGRRRDVPGRLVEAQCQPNRMPVPPSLRP